MASTSASYTEGDIIRSLVKKGAITELYKECNAGSPGPGSSSKKGAAFDGADEQIVAKDQLKQVAKIWTASCKLIRSQCNKDRIIDSLFFGSFGKTSVLTPGS